MPEIAREKSFNVSDSSLWMLFLRYGLKPTDIHLGIISEGNQIAPISPVYIETIH